jgi:predicted transcriptional regulator
MATKEAAVEILFKEGLEQKDISKILKLSEVTVSKIVTKGNLRRKRTMQSIAKKTSEDNALMALEHQSTIVRLMAEKLREELAENPSMDDLKAALIPKGEIDALQKLFTTIKGKELEWSNYVKIIREFIAWVRDRNPELAQQIIDPADDYINEKRRVMS